MLKSLMLGLDGSQHNQTVVELGLRWAKRFYALAVGVAVIDEPGILTSEAVLFAGGSHWHATDAATALRSHSHHRVEHILDQFARHCGEADVAYRTLEAVGPPYVQILKESQRFDLVLLGQETHFGFGHEEDPDETLARVLQDCPRPVVTVPKTIGEGRAVVVAYDGSLQASRALYAFEASGLGCWEKVHIVSIDRENHLAARQADRAAEFLQFHGVDAIPHPIESSSPPADVIQEEINASGAGLLVMGAYGQPVLREFFLGSVTRSVLKACPVPVFCYH